MKIQQLKTKDIDAFYDLYVVSTKEENEKFWPGLKVKPKAQIKKLIHSASWFEVLVIEKEGIFIGYTIVWDFFRSWEKHLFIDDLFVKEEYRSRGIWSKIISFLKKKKKSIYLFVDIYNIDAIRFYKKNWAKMVEVSNDQNFTMRI